MVEHAAPAPAPPPAWVVLVAVIAADGFGKAALEAGEAAAVAAVM
jgi:hypothetical protein